MPITSLYPTAEAQFEAQIRAVLLHAFPSLPGGDPDVTSVPVHRVGPDPSIVCRTAGFVEPITWSLVRFFNPISRTKNAMS